MSMSLEEFDGKTRALAEAWSSGDPAQVADHYAAGKGITINNGENQFGREAMLAMAGGFMAAFPDMKLRRDFFRFACDRGVFGWTFQGHHSETGNLVVQNGWEEMELGADGLIVNSLGWFDAVDYERQVAGGST